MPSFTVQKLIDRAMTAADMHDDFVTPSQWIDWLNVEIALFDSLIAKAGYVLKLSTLTITADGSASYPLTPEPVALLAVYHEVDGRYRRLRTDDIFDGYAGRWTNDGDARTFQVTQGENQLELSLHPVPKSGTYKVLVIPATAAVADVDDTVAYPLGWEEWLVAQLALRALGKEETVNPTLSAAISRVESLVEQAAWNRMFAASGARVRNVDQVERHWFKSLAVPSRDYWVFF